MAQVGKRAIGKAGNRGVYREKRSKGLEIAAAALSYAEFMRVLAALCVTEINRKQFPKEQENRGPITGKAPLIFCICD
jgi:hypothetical protein